MTQVKSAQRAGKNLALRKRADGRSLAQRRAAFATQMRAMALSDLTAVSKRLKGLHRDLEHRDGHKWTHYDLAAKMGIRPRTFQSWENGEVENSDGKGYDKMARYYSRRLGRKVTRQWILFGDEDKRSTDSTGEAVNEAEAAGDEIRAKLDEVLDQQAELLAMLSEVRAEQERLRQRQEPGAHDAEETGS